ncbi:hypothetical protein OAF82_01090 [bacterium]|nr:hypothetical protein [bacterium]
MNGEVLKLDGSPIDGLVRFKDEGIDRRGRRRMSLHIGHNLHAEAPVWNPLPERYATYTSKMSQVDDGLWPIWTIPLYRLDHDEIHHRHCETRSYQMMPLLESGALVAGDDDPVVLLHRARKNPNDGLEDAGEDFPSVALTTGTPASFGWLLDYCMQWTWTGSMRGPVIRVNTSLVCAAGWIRRENGELWTA